MTALDMDRWYVRTDAYLDAIEDYHFQYVTVYTKPRVWPRVAVGVLIALTTFVITAMVI
jgi:hypothetical protein